MTTMNRRSFLSFAPAALAVGALALTAPKVLAAPLRQEPLPVTSDDDAELRWLREAPLGYLRVLNEIADVYIERFGWDDNASADVIDAHCDAVLSLFREKIQHALADDPELAEWVRGGYRAWIARGPK